MFISVLAAVSVLSQASTTGLPISANVPSFMPTHLTGPNAGKTACPLCIYGNRPQLQIWAQASQTDRAIELAKTAAKDLGNSVQTYIVVVPTSSNKPAPAAITSLKKAQIGTGFVTFVPSWTDKETSGLYNHTGSTPPKIRLYSVVNRRLYARWDNPNSQEWKNVVQKVKESSRYVAESALTDRQISPPWEPGQKFRVSFEVFDKKGKPVSNAKVTAWQTDKAGLYNPREFGHIAPRLQVTAWTNDKGRIDFETIYPGPYPTQPEPSHIHFAIPVNGKSQWRTLWFEGDPMLTAEKRRWEENNEETLIVIVDKSKSPWTVYHRYILQ